jgi:predicted nucleic acid-binding protein
MPTYLLDTNILLRAVDKSSPDHGVVASALTRLAGRGDDLCLFPQVIIEFWCVATRPVDVNGFGWEPERVETEIREAVARFPLIVDVPLIFDHWLRLVATLRIRGKQVHDARIVATMQAHGIAHVLTLNVADYRPYPGIEAVHPSSI